MWISPEDLDMTTKLEVTRRRNVLLQSRHEDRHSDQLDSQRPIRDDRRSRWRTEDHGMIESSGEWSGIGCTRVRQRLWRNPPRVLVRNSRRNECRGGKLEERCLSARQVSKTVGRCCKIECEAVEVEWSLANYFHLSDNVMYESPYFSCMNASWYLKLYLSSETKQNIGWTGIFLYRRDSGPPITIELTLGLKIEYGKKYEQFHFKQTFQQDYSFGIDEFIPRWKLEKIKSELVPSGVLTVFCCLKQCDSAIKNDPRKLRRGNYSDDQLDIAGRNSVHVSTQTEASEFNTIVMNLRRNSVGCGIQETVSEGITQLQNRFREMLVSGKHTDVTLRVKGREFHAHRFVLAAQSPVFMAMMDHETKEKATGIVDIEDTDPDSFPDFLHYLYTGCLENLISENVPSLYETADKYQVDDLKKACLRRMNNCISTENFCDIMSLSLRYYEKELIDVATKFFVENSMQIVVTTKWQMFLRSSPDASNELLIKLIQEKVL